MKKHFGIAAAALTAGCVLLISGCSGCSSCSSCNGNTVVVTPLYSNWYSNTVYGGIQPTHIDNAERAIYDVTFSDEDAGNSTYSVKYADGTYTTEFAAVVLDRDGIDRLIDDKYSGGYPDEVTAYYYKTELTIPEVTFKVKGDEKSFTGDKVVTVCYFLPVKDELQPLYSYQYIKSVTPADYQIGSLDEAYREIEQTYVTYYDYGCTEATTFVTDGDEENSYTVSGLRKNDQVLFDVAQVNIGARALNLSSSLSQAVNVYSPSGRLQTYTLAGTDQNLSDDEKSDYAQKLNCYLDGADTVDAVAVRVMLNANFQGVSQTYYFAAVDNQRNNEARATLLKMTVPAAYSLGTFTYSLRKLENGLWND